MVKWIKFFTTFFSLLFLTSFLEGCRTPNNPGYRVQSEALANMTSTQLSAMWFGTLNRAAEKHGNYLYASTFRMNRFLSILLNLWKTNPLEVKTSGSTTAVATFRVIKPWGTPWIELSTRGLSEDVVLHETVHYFNQANNRFQALYGGGDTDEKTAWGLQNLFGMATAGLRSFENRYLKNHINDHPDQLERDWKNLWVGAASLPTRLLEGTWQNGNKTGELGVDGWKWVKAISGIDISCEKLAKAYGLELKVDLVCPVSDERLL